jgi:hypothetical protein
MNWNAAGTALMRNSMPNDAESDSLAFQIMHRQAIPFCY